MLPKGSVPARMQNDRQARGFGERDHFLGDTHAATPVDIGLQNIHRVVAGSPLKRQARVPVLSCGKRLPGQALTQLEVCVEVFGNQAFLDPFKFVGA